IANLLSEQPRFDWEHLGFMMYDYKGLLMGWPGILQLHSVRNKCRKHSNN
ncbi:Sorting nexin, partial [Caligus rogercresseyi]